MKKAPKQIRHGYWKYQFAALTFDEAGEMAAYLHNNPRPKMKYSLLTSLFVLYGRPFKQHKDIRISDDIVPPEYRAFHNYLIVLRDKLFAHVDENAPSDWEEKHLSKIYIGYRNGEFRPGFAQLFRDGYQFHKVKSLCDILFEICHAKSEEIALPYMEGTSLRTELTYEVDLSEGDKYLLKLREF